MRNGNFDERYPAMFQPGGDGPDSAGEPAAHSPAAPPEPDEKRHAVQANSGPGYTTEAGPGETGGHGDGPAWRWWVPLAAAVAMIAAGLFALTAQYWLPPSMEMDPAAFQGIVLQPWGQLIYPAAPALLGTGTGILGALILMASRRSAAAEPPLRAAMAVLAALAGAAGWVFLFATYLFPEVIFDGYDSNGRPPPMPWTYLVMPVGTWLLSVALLLLATLLTVPRRWHSGRPEGDALPLGGRPSAGRALVFGVVATVAGVLTLFAPYLFPLATGTTTIEVSAGNTVSQAGWATVAQFVSGPLLLAGLVILAWALLHLALSPRSAGHQGQGEAPTVEPGDGEQ